MSAAPTTSFMCGLSKQEVYKNHDCGITSIGQGGICLNFKRASDGRLIPCECPVGDHLSGFAPSGGVVAVAPAGNCSTSGHVSVDASITPHINDHTVHVASSASAEAVPIGELGAGKSSLYYLRLWAKVLRRKSSIFDVIVDASVSKCCLKKKNQPAILWFSLVDPRTTRNLYIWFRLCGDDVSVFLKHLNANDFEVVTSVTPPTMPRKAGM